MKINNKLYDILKWVAIICLPALGTLYHALSGLWGFPYSAEVVGTISAVTTCLGIILGISTAEYHKDNATVTIEQIDIKEDGENESSDDQ